MRLVLAKNPRVFAYSAKDGAMTTRLRSTTPSAVVQPQGELIIPSIGSDVPGIHGTPTNPLTPAPFGDENSIFVIQSSLLERQLAGIIIIIVRHDQPGKLT